MSQYSEYQSSYHRPRRRAGVLALQAVLYLAVAGATGLLIAALSRLGA